jgi:prophage tail gpP-like protein
MKVAVRVKGSAEVYLGWTEAEITRSLDDASSSFTLSTVHVDVNLAAGDLVEILYGNLLVMTGLIDSVRESYSATEHQFQISGRSLTKDLIDCSAKPKTFNNTSLSSIVNDLIKDYSVSVSLDPTVSNVIIPNFVVANQGSETVIEAIIRLANSQKLIVTDDQKGRLVLTNVTSTKSDFYVLNAKNDLKSNVISGTHSDDETNRFKTVTLRSQIKGTDEKFGKNAQEISKTATDNTVKRNRLLIIDSEKPLNAQEAQELVDWQLAANSGKSIEVNYEVFGWTQNNKLWDINTLIQITDDFFNLNCIVLVNKVEFKISESGTTCNLTLHPRSAYVPNPFIKQDSVLKKINKAIKKAEKVEIWNPDKDQI